MQQSAVHKKGFFYEPPFNRAINNYRFYSALSHPPVRSSGNASDLSIYRPQGKSEYGIFRYKAADKGLLQVGGSHGTETVWPDQFEIAWAKMGDKGQLVLFLHDDQPIGRNGRRFKDRFRVSAKPFP